MYFTVKCSMLCPSKSTDVSTIKKDQISENNPSPKPIIEADRSHPRLVDERRSSKEGHHQTVGPAWTIPPASGPLAVQTGVSDVSCIEDLMLLESGSEGHRVNFLSTVCGKVASFLLDTGGRDRYVSSAFVKKHGLVTTFVRETNWSTGAWRICDEHGREAAFYPSRLAAPSGAIHQLSVIDHGDSDLQEVSCSGFCRFCRQKDVDVVLMQPMESLNEVNEVDGPRKDIPAALPEILAKGAALQNRIKKLIERFKDRFSEVDTAPKLRPLVLGTDTAESKRANEARLNKIKADRAEARQLQEARAAANKARFDNKLREKGTIQSYRIGETVKLRNETQTKGQPNWHGPFEVFDALGNNVYKIVNPTGSEFPHPVNGNRLQPAKTKDTSLIQPWALPARLQPPADTADKFETKKVTTEVKQLTRAQKKALKIRIRIPKATSGMIAG
ncbi:uncharacterized protein MELLADRAFT_109981 [Melampsora larici-populina 98AG31]|uniref:Uncharacterized protein n=1 Tax=Melampsora larici-populina (strain 98AG31 / pathotype 3-4-7) TaxID=747676 RepID=F4RY93_MELLP|nr:uncharacterized protein MELLADRAFT_109981 [Melampsora larici-populina 98AG31]EGG02677.1 hypothetical protein MELLADRAFT_109981 [Melampsora larici-populina 98AG31]